MSSLILFVYTSNYSINLYYYTIDFNIHYKNNAFKKNLQISESKPLEE